MFLIYQFRLALSVIQMNKIKIFYATFEPDIKIIKKLIKPPPKSLNIRLAIKIANIPTKAYARKFIKMCLDILNVANLPLKSELSEILKLLINKIYLSLNPEFFSLWDKLLQLIPLINYP